MIFGIINARDINDNKTFWKTVKPIFSDKISHRDIIGLKKGGKKHN